MTARTAQYETSEEGSCWMFFGWMLNNWLTVWLSYIVLLNALLSVSMYISMMPQYTSLHDLAAGHATIGAMLAQLCGYPLMYVLVAVKSQILINMASQQLDGRSILEQTTLLVLELFPCAEQHKDKVDAGVRTSKAVFMVGGMVCGMVLTIAWGMNFGISSGIVLGGLLFSTLFAYLELAVMIVKIFRERRQEASYKALLPDAQPKERPKVVYTYTLVGLAVQITVGLLVFLNCVSCGWLIFATALGIVLYALTFDRFLPEALNQPMFIAPWTSCFWMTIAIAVALAVLMGLLPPLTSALVAADADVLGPEGRFNLVNGSSYDTKHVGPGRAHGYGPYPVCQQMLWDTPRPEAEEMTALDILVFTQAIYLNHRAEQLALLGNATAGTELGPVEIEALEDMTEVARVGVYVLPQVQTRIIAIRGSSQAADWIFNADVWGPAMAKLRLSQSSWVW